MMSQSTMTANTADILYSTRAMLFVMLLCMGYSLSRPEPVIEKEKYFLLSTITQNSSPEKGWPDLPLWQKAAAEKAVERYAGAQEKKWRRWNEAMFQRST